MIYLTASCYQRKRLLTRQKTLGYIRSVALLLLINATAIMPGLAQAGILVADITNVSNTNISNDNNIGNSGNLNALDNPISSQQMMLNHMQTQQAEQQQQLQQQLQLQNWQQQQTLEHNLQHYQPPAR